MNGEDLVEYLAEKADVYGFKTVFIHFIFTYHACDCSCSFWNAFSTNVDFEALFVSLTDSLSTCSGEQTDALLPNGVFRSRFQRKILVAEA